MDTVYKKTFTTDPLPAGRKSSSSRGNGLPSGPTRQGYAGWPPLPRVRMALTGL